MTINFQEAAVLLKQNQSVSYDAEKRTFTKDGFWLRFAKVFKPSIQERMVSEIAKVSISMGAEFSKQILTSYGKKYAHLLDKLDRDIHNDHQYQVAKNVDDFARWKRWGFDPELFSEHYEFARFLLDTPLGSQMKLFADRTFRMVNNERVPQNIIEMKDREPAILVDGVLTKFSDFKNRFEVVSDRGEKVLRLITDKTPDPKLVYTYLDNGQGLQKHNPYGCTEPVAVGHLENDEFERTMKSAQEFYADKKFSKDFPHIIQLVSSEVEGVNTNFSNLLLKPKHPWIRIIIGQDQNGFKKGDVFDGGFGWTRKSMLPGIASTGRFRVMDVWNYQSAKNRIVTNIPISDETCKKLKAEIMSLQREAIELGRELGFNLFRHNCTSFINRVGKFIPGLVDTRTTITSLIYQVSPNWFQSICDVVESGYKGTRALGERVTNAMPSFISVPAKLINRFVHRVFDILLSLPINLFTWLTGGMLGQKKRGFEEPVGPQGVRTSLKDFYYYLPGVLQQWQRKQKSTVIFAKPTTFAVAPPVPKN